MKGIILAGGQGTRLRPMTKYCPKPMMPILNKPVMEYTIQLLKQYDITEIAVLIQYKGDMIQSYFGNGEKYGVNLYYFEDRPPLGTAGSVKAAETFIDETCIVISGDVLTNVNIEEAFSFHKNFNKTLTIIMKEEKITRDFGAIITSSTGKIINFVEKPKWEMPSNYVNTGMYIIDPQLCDFIEAGKFRDFGNDIIPSLLYNGEDVYGYVTTDYWLDIGTLSLYIKGREDMLNGTFEKQMILK